jgi:hypothetical protein
MQLRTGPRRITSGPNPITIKRNRIMQQLEHQIELLKDANHKVKGKAIRPMWKKVPGEAGYDFSIRNGKSTFIEVEPNADAVYVDTLDGLRDEVIPELINRLRSGQYDDRLMSEPKAVKKAA